MHAHSFIYNIYVDYLHTANSRLNFLLNSRLWNQPTGWLISLLSYLKEFSISTYPKPLSESILSQIPKLSTLPEYWHCLIMPHSSPPTYIYMWYVYTCMWYVYVWYAYVIYIYFHVLFALLCNLLNLFLSLFFYHNHPKFKVSISLLQQALYWSPSIYSCHSSSSQPILYSVAKMILSLTHLKNQWFPTVLSIKSKLLNVAGKAVLGLMQIRICGFILNSTSLALHAPPLLSPFCVPLATGSLNITFRSA